MKITAAVSVGRVSVGAVLLGVDPLDTVFERRFQAALADGPEHELEKPSLEVLAFPYDDVVDAGGPVGRCG